MDRINRIVRNFQVRPGSRLFQAVTLRVISGEKHETLWYSTRRSNVIESDPDDLLSINGVVKLTGYEKPIELWQFREARMKFKLALARHGAKVQIPLCWFNTVHSSFDFKTMVLTLRAGELYLTGLLPLYHSEAKVYVAIKIVISGGINYWCLYLGKPGMSAADLLSKGRKLYSSEAEHFIGMTRAFDWLRDFIYWH